MSNGPLDDVDRGILYALQRDARNVTIAEEVDVSASTVRNRIGRLEDIGVIEGYYPKINSERAESAREPANLPVAFGASRPPVAKSTVSGPISANTRRRSAIAPPDDDNIFTNPQYSR